MVLVVLAHVPLMMLFLWGWRISRDEPQPQLVFFGIWPQIPAPAPVPVPATVRPTPTPVFPKEPDTSITLPPQSNEPSDVSRPSLDWRAEVAAAAARQAAPAASNTFSAPPKVASRPCEKQKSSWEWNKEPGKAGFTRLSNGLPLPYVTVGRCVIGLGFFGCPLQKAPEANSHLLDDMRDGKTSPSSIADHERCD